MKTVTAKKVTENFFREPSANNFKTYNLHSLIDGSECENKTFFQIGYTADGIIIKFKCDYQGKIYSDFKDYNDPVHRGEVVEFFVSPYGDLKQYFEFDLSPFNVLFNARIYNIDNYYAEASPIASKEVQTLTAIFDKYYTAAIYVPFSLIVKERNLTEIITLPWHFNAYRTDNSNNKKKFCAYSPTENVSYHTATKFAKILFD